MTPPGDELAVIVAEGHSALARGAWEEAFAAFERATALPGGEAVADAAEGLGMAAWWLDAGDVVFEARERAFRLYRQSGDDRAAGRVAMTLAVDHLQFRGEVAVAQGWLSRAESLLGNLPLCPEHAWLKLWQADFAMDLGESAAKSHALAAEAARIGRELGSLDLEMPARALEGLASVVMGNRDEGVRLLDEAASAALSGELTDPVSIAFSCCYLVTACERVRDLERAVQWCRRLAQYCEKTRYNSMLAHCKTQHAGVLTWSGKWSDAETALYAALKQLADTRPALEPGAVLRLADLRRRQGKLDEAEALVGPLEGQPGVLALRAELALDRGDAAGAVQLAERHARQIEASYGLDRFFAVELLVRAHAATSADEAGDLEAWVAELLTFVERTMSDALRGAACVCAGHAAARRGELSEARRAFEDSVDAYARAGMPFERACARLELARVLLRLSDARGSDLQARTAHGAFAELGAARHERLAAELLGEAAPSSPKGPTSTEPPAASQSQAARGSPDGLTARELEVLSLIADGLSNAEIGKRLFVSEFTIKRHVANILTKLSLSSRAAAAAYAVRRGLG